MRRSSRNGEMVWVRGGSFAMGSSAHHPEESPVRQVNVGDFWMDRSTVTNRQFECFVAATGYVTLAERTPRAEDYPGALPELLVPASIVFQRPERPVDLDDPYEWWAFVPGACWRHPRGPHTSIEGLEDHPVVHVAHEDAQAYALWAGKDLPTEAEWEFAARGGLDGAEFVWGDTWRPGSRYMANTWQGEFPHENTAEDGFEWTAPVASYPENGFGLFDMAGNVWEWTTDAYTARGHASPGSSRRRRLRNRVEIIPRKVIKGGSYLCAPGYGQRYRPAARMAQPIDTSTCHIGLRCIVRES